jgi:dihydrodipicolinate synthase/N-acetylneuraminate lyase
MVLPPYVYQGNWREMKTHVATVFEATPLSCMLYNNPVAYGTDFLPEQIRELAAEHENFEAVKESSTDARRVSAIRALLDRRLEITVGVDDAVLEPKPSRVSSCQTARCDLRPGRVPPGIVTKARDE